MNRNATRVILLSMLFAMGSEAFSPSQTMRPAPFFVTLIESENPQISKMPSMVSSEKKSTPQSLSAGVDSKPASPKAIKKPSKAANDGHGKTGPFAPLVLMTKEVMGETELNKLRAKAISMHSDVIGKFVETSETSFGQQALKVMFAMADKDKSGTIDEEELKYAMRAMGFDHLKEKQILGIFERADLDANGALDFEEWKLEAPKTLRTNLIKLAKKNGGELGFLV